MLPSASAKLDLRSWKATTSSCASNSGTHAVGDLSSGGSCVPATRLSPAAQEKSSLLVRSEVAEGMHVLSAVSRTG